VKFTLTHKAIILVTIPLLFEFVFIAALAYLLNQAEEESTLVFRSANIGNCSNKLIKDIFELSAIPHNEIMELFASNGYKIKIETIRSDLKELSQAAKDNPSEQLIVKKSIASGEEAFILVEELEKTFQSGNLLGAIDQLKQLRGELRSCMQHMISNDLITMAQTEQQKAVEYHNKQLASRKQIQFLLIAGLLFNAIITIFVAWLITKKIVGGLGLLIDNNYRLVSGVTLNPPIGGSDEIANLDSTFHEMAISLSEAKQREKSMIEHSLDVICSLDPQGKLTAVNPACKRILGYPESILLGMNLRGITVEEDIEPLNNALSSAGSGETETKFESRVRQENGGIVDVLWSIHWVESASSFFCVGHDITARKEMERLKQQFMAMISHDLRTPLTTIGNYLEMLAAGIFGSLSDKGQHLLKVAENNANRMLTLINDLLDLEKAEFGGLKLDCSVQNLNDLLDQSIKSVANLASEKQVSLELAETDLVVYADPKRVAQVLVNLLNNAIKFSPSGGIIKVIAKVNDGMAFIHVVDQGRGIPEHLREAIFERFQQVEISDAADKGGSGLGLAICKAIVELHGGHITVENNKDAGSTFSFSLPLTKQDKVLDTTKTLVH